MINHSIIFNLNYIRNLRTRYSYFYSNFSYGILHIGRVGSVFTTLSVAVDRFYAVKYPLKMIESSHLLIICSVSFSLLYNIPRFLEFETNSSNVSMEETNATSLLDKVLCNYKYIDISRTAGKLDN